MTPHPRLDANILNGGGIAAVRTETNADGAPLLATRGEFSRTDNRGDIRFVQTCPFGAEM